MAKPLNSVGKHRHPEELKKALPQDAYRRILGLDLGSACGFAAADVSARPGVAPCMTAGLLDLSLSHYDTGALRLLRLRDFLYAAAPDLVLIEDVKHTPAMIPGMSASAVMARAATAMQVLAGMAFTVAMWCEERGVPMEAATSTAIKKHAVGSGRANKEQMIAAANQKFAAGLCEAGYESSGHDNIADALFVCDIAVQRYMAALRD